MAGSWLLALLALGSIVILVGGRMAEQIRRVGLLKAVGATPALVAGVLLAEYLAVAGVAAAASLVARRWRPRYLPIQAPACWELLALPRSPCPQSGWW